MDTNTSALQIITCPFCDWSMARADDRRIELAPAFSAHLDTH